VRGNGRNGEIKFKTFVFNNVRKGKGLPVHHNMKMHEGVELQLHTLLVSSSHDGVSGQLQARSLYPCRKRLGTHWIEGWVGSRGGLGEVLLPDWNRTPARSPVIILTEPPQPHPTLRTCLRSHAAGVSLPIKYRGKCFLVVSDHSVVDL
jgi:hypothetical protein